MLHEDDSYARNLAELVDRVGRLSRELQFAHGLNPAQWEALRYISRANRYSQTPGAMAEFLGATKGTISQTLISLENKGYVERVRSVRDRRVTQLCLTGAGRDLLRNDPLLLIEKVASGMDADAGRQLLDGLSRLFHALRMESDAKTFGLCGDCSLLMECDGGGAAQTCHCGFTNEELDTGERNRLCINFQRS